MKLDNKASEIEENKTPAEDDRFYLTPGMKHGTGFDTLSGKFLNASTCLEQFEIKKIGSRNVSTLSVALLRNWKEFQDMMNFDGGMKATIATQAGPIQIGGKIGFGNYVKKNSQNVFLLVKIDAEIADYQIVNPKLLLEGDPEGDDENSIRNLFKTKFDKFRERCGDRFLSTITTGGSYIGVIEIEGGNKYRKNKIAIEVSGKHIPSSIKLEGKFQLFLETLDRKYNMRFHVLSRGPFSGGIVNNMSRDDLYKDGIELEGIELGSELPDFESGIPDIDDNDSVFTDASYFIEDIDNFFTQLKKLENGEIDWKQAAYIARYENYQETALEILAGESSYKEKKRMLDKMLSMIDNYERSQVLAEEIITYHEQYDFKDPDETIIKTINGMVDQVQKIKNYITKTNIEIIKCTNNEDSCRSFYIEQTFSDLGMESPEAIFEKFPVKRQAYPATCHEYEKYYVITNDKPVTLYMGGDKNKPFTVRCLGDTQGNSNTFAHIDVDSRMPSDWKKAYIEFENKALLDENVFDAGFNFSRTEWFAARELFQETAGFNAVNVTLSREQIAVNPHDKRFLSRYDTTKSSDTIPVRYAEVALCSNALVFDRDAESDYYIKTGADISFNHTPFEIDLAEVDFAVSKADIESEIIISEDKKNIKMKLSGISNSCRENTVLMKNLTENCCATLAPKRELRLNYE